MNELLSDKDPAPHQLIRSTRLPVFNAEGEALIGTPFQRCPRCGGAILSNLPPRSLREEMGCLLFVLCFSAVAPLVAPGPQRWLLWGAVLPVLVIWIYREAKRDRATRTHPRWLAGKPENES